MGAFGALGKGETEKGRNGETGKEREILRFAQNDKGRSVGSGILPAVVLIS